VSRTTLSRQCSASAESRRCEACGKAGAMNRADRTNAIMRRCRYCGHQDARGQWSRKKNGTRATLSVNSGHRVTRTAADRTAVGMKT